LDRFERKRLRDHCQNDDRGDQQQCPTKAHSADLAKGIPDRDRWAARRPAPIQDGAELDDEGEQ
jgi:hypothetical protein